MIVKDLSSLEKVSSYKVVKLQSDVSSSLARAEAAEKKCYENHLLHQVRETIVHNKHYLANYDCETDELAYY